MHHMGHKMGHRIPGHWKYQPWGQLPLRKLHADLLPSASPHPPLPPAMCSFIGRSITTCPHKIHPRKRTSKPLHTHDSMHRHTCIPMFRGKDPHSQPQVTPSPRPSASPHFTVKGSIWGTNTPPPHTEGVAWQQGKIYHHYPNIISKLDSGSS